MTTWYMRDAGGVVHRRQDAHESSERLWTDCAADITHHGTFDDWGRLVAALWLAPVPGLRARDVTCLMCLARETKKERQR